MIASLLLATESTPLLTLRSASYTPCRKSGNTCSTCWIAATRKLLQRRRDSVTQRNGRMCSTHRGPALLQMMPFEGSTAQRRNSAHGARQGRDVACSGRTVVQHTDAGNWPHRPRGPAAMKRALGSAILMSPRGCLLHLGLQSTATVLLLHCCMLRDCPAGHVSDQQ